MTARLRAALVMEERRRDLVYPAHVLASIGDRAEWAVPPLTGRELLAAPEILRDVDVLFAGWGTPPLDEGLLEQAPFLKAVFYAAGSVRGIATDAFWGRRIPIVSAAAANAIPVAEFTFAQIVLGLKQSYRISREFRRRHSYPDKSDVRGAYRTSVGIVSLGDIGVRVARRLQSLDVAVHAYDPHADTQVAEALGVRLTSLDDVFGCDVVTVHAPLLPDTHGMIGEPLLRRLPANATFINTARGALVDERSLARVFRERDDLTAVLDVTHPEPPAVGSPLYELDNVILTAHLAGSHGSECARLGELVGREFHRFVEGRPLHHVVTPARAQVRA